MSKNLISHTDDKIPYENELRLAHLKERIKTNFDSDTSLQLIQVLNELNDFELGKFLIQHEGLNGHWTHEVVTWNEKKAVKNKTEKALFAEIPATLATRQRFHTFKQIIRSLLSAPNQVIASIPSGYMSEVLLLDAEILEHTQMIAVDLDKDALNGAFALARNQKIAEKLKLIHEDAWNIQLTEEVDIITSNGLNIYEHDNNRVIKLYEKFYRALKKDGTLITSFLTPPPTLSPASPWKMENINLTALQLQKAIFLDILNAKWSAYRTEDLTKQQLEHAGFKEIKFIYDDAHLFPTVVAKK